MTKIFRNICLHFARQDGQDGKKRKENHATKMTKIPKTKRRKYGMNLTSKTSSLQTTIHFETDPNQSKTKSSYECKDLFEISKQFEIQFL